MTHHQVTMSEMKVALSELLIDQVEERSYSEWFALLNEKLNDHFNIEQTEFFLYNKSHGKFLSIEDYKLSFQNSKKLCKEKLLTGEKEAVIAYIQEAGYREVDDFILFKSDHSEPLAMLFIKSTERWHDFSESSYITTFENLIAQFIKSVRYVNELIIEGKKFRLLFNLTESFTSTMTSETILNQMIETVERILPTAEKTLILSHEQPGMKYPYEVFNHLENCSLVVQAFLDGQTKTKENKEANTIMMHVPIKGRQGVYGVLKIEDKKDSFYSMTQKNLIQMLINTTGNALENASLYNQSYRLNEDLKLVNETSQKLNSGLTLNEMLAYLKKQLNTVLAPDEVVILFYDEGGKYKPFKAMNCFFQSEEGKEYLQYVSTHIHKNQSALFQADFNSALTKNPLFKSIIGIPILNQKEIIGVAICLHKERYFFSFDRFKLAKSLIIHGSLSISNLQLREKMRKLAERDHLTGLFARRYLEKHIYHVVHEKRGGSFLLFDIDNFKHVNDRLGHDVGDRVLQQLGARLIEEVGDKGIPARWGGEEFAVYLSTYNQEELAETSRKLLEIIPTITDPSVTVSMGVVYWEPDQLCSFESLFKEADQNLYQAKEEGKNRLVLSS